MSLLSNSEMIQHQNPNNMIKDPFNRKSYLSHGELGLSQLQHYVGPDNVPELRAVHRDAYPTAIFYLATILGLYLLGLLAILIHYMNSSYGKWAWTLSDVWDEIRYFTSLSGLHLRALQREDTFRTVVQNHQKFSHFGVQFSISNVLHTFRTVFSVSNVSLTFCTVFSVSNISLTFCIVFSVCNVSITFCTVFCTVFSVINVSLTFCTVF